ncbi:MAG: metallophosphoesterase [Gemmataceae bacterium]
MAGLELRLQTLRRAVQAIRSTPGRRGRLVTIDADDVLVAGDLHGHVENFRQLLLRADLAKNPRRHLVVQELIHGPFRYPAGGDKSHQLVDVVCALKCQYPARFHYLIGNHELAQATGTQVLKHEADLNEQFVLGVRMAYGERADEVYGLYLELFAEIPFAVRTPGRTFLSHSLPSMGRMEQFDPAALEREPTVEADIAPGGSLYALVWGRDTREETVAAFLRKVDADVLVSGHIPCESGFELPSPRHVILDCLGSPAAYALLPAPTPVTPEDLPACVHLLG